MVVLVAMGGGALLSFSFGKKGEAAEISEIGVPTGEMGELPLFPLLIKGEGADVSSFRIKKPPTISPTTLHSTRAVRGKRGGYGVRYGVDPARACPCTVLGLAQQRSASCVAQARGLLSVY